MCTVSDEHILDYKFDDGGGVDSVGFLKSTCIGDGGFYRFHSVVHVTTFTIEHPVAGKGTFVKPLEAVTKWVWH